MEKVISPKDWDFGEQTTAIVKMASGGRLLGADYKVLVKRAGEEFASRVKDIEINDDQLPVHVIALGATELGSANRNGDGFKEATLKKTHKTFEQHAKVFRNHKNKDPDKSYGQVKYSFYNDAMRRVELLLALNKTKEAADKYGGFVADREQESLERGDDLAVSMACILDPNYPILTRDRGYVGISEVTTNDYVWTSAGRWRKVTQLNRRTYTGEVFRFSMNGLPFPIELTADHPMYAKVFEKSAASTANYRAKRFFENTARFNAQPAGWVHAKEVGIGDRFFVTPVTEYPGFAALNSISLAMLMGYYVAEGTVGVCKGNPNMVAYHCNIADRAVREIPTIVNIWSPDVTVDIRPHAKSNFGCSVNVYSAVLARFMLGTVGKLCRGKIIPPEIFNANRDAKLAFLATWMDGDGFCDAKGGHWSTSSINLVLQGRDLLLSVGIPASIYAIDHAKCATSGKENSGWEYTLNISSLDVWQLAPWSAKAAHFESPITERTKPACLRLCPDGLYAVRIKDVTTRFVSDTVTYNFEVEEDESYSAAGLISHNCRVPFDVCSSCGNQARTRAEYCDEDSCVAPTGEKRGGCKHNLTRVHEDGHVLHVDNPNPDFFDISSVFRPADRIAYGGVADYLQKAASGEVLGGAALAEAYGISPPLSLLLDGIPDARLAHQVKLAYQLAELEDQESTGEFDLLRALAPGATQPDLGPLGALGSTKMAEGLAALASQKVALPLRDFLRLAGHRDEQIAYVTEKVARALPGVYQRLISSGDLVERIRTNPFTPSANLASSSQRAWAEKLAQDYSLDRRYIQQRLWKSAIHNTTGPAKLQPTEKQAETLSEAEKALAQSYALYKLAFLSAVKDDLQLTQRAVIQQNYLIS